MVLLQLRRLSFSMIPFKEKSKHIVLAKTIILLVQIIMSLDSNYLVNSILNRKECLIELLGYRH